MKLVFVSDLHVDAGPLGKTAEKLLPQIVRAADPDIFIIGGDIASRLSVIDRTLEEFCDLRCPRLYVPGNHDIWISSIKEREQAITSRDKYDRLIPNICSDNGFHFLPHNPTVINGIGFAGAIGWYDYSFRNHEFDRIIPEQVYRRKHFGGLVWNDRRYARWGNPDREVADEMARDLEADLSRLEPQSDRIVVVTHHLPFVEMVRRSGNPKWDFFNAFMGSASLGQAITKHRSVFLVLSGHTHFRVDIMVDGTQAVTSPLGYTRERPGAPEHVIRESIFIKEL